MPFDGNPPAEVTARDRMMQLRDFLDRLPDERFDYGTWQTPCDTCACIAGWQGILMQDRVPSREYGDPSHRAWRRRMAASLGLSEDDGYNLFVRAADMDDDLVELFGDEGLPSRAQTITVLDHFLETGEIDWSVAK